MKPFQNNEETPIMPEKGMGATNYAGSDCYPYTIVDFNIGKTGRITIWVTPDEYKWVDDPKGDGNQAYSGKRGHYEYTTVNPNATREESVEVKLWTKQGQRHWRIGSRKFYNDPSF
jgi:hypothetical protein